MGLFKGMKDATFREGGNYMQPDCVYDLEVKALRTGTTRKKDNFFVGDFVVIGTTSTRHAPGDVVNYFTDDSKDGFLGNCKAVFCAVLGTLGQEPVDPSSVGEAEAEALVGPPLDDDGKPLSGGIPGTAARGVRIRCQTRGTTTLKGTPFTVHDWYPVIAAK